MIDAAGLASGVASDAIHLAPQRRLASTIRANRAAGVALRLPARLYPLEWSATRDAILRFSRAWLALPDIPTFLTTRRSFPPIPLVKGLCHGYRTAEDGALAGRGARRGAQTPRGGAWRRFRWRARAHPGAHERAAEALCEISGASLPCARQPRAYPGDQRGDRVALGGAAPRARLASHPDGARAECHRRR